MNAEMRGLSTTVHIPESPVKNSTSSRSESEWSDKQPKNKPETRTELHNEEAEGRVQRAQDILWRILTKIEADKYQVCLAVFKRV